MLNTATNSHDQQLKFAAKHDLAKIYYSFSQLAGSGSLKPRARRWLFFVVAVARMGFDGIHAPVWAVCKAQFEATGQTFSQSTAFRALRDLERAGYIRRQQYRVGRDRFAVKIFFNMEKIAFWLQDRPQIAAVTCNHTPLQLSLWEQSDLTSKGSLVNSSNYSPSKLDKPARAKVPNKSGVTNPSKRHQREDGRLYTVRLVSRGLGKARRRVILARLTLELFKPKLRSSGFNWERWTEKAWLEMSIPEREHVAREQIIPALENTLQVERAESQNRRVFAAGGAARKTPPPAPAKKPATGAQIECMLRAARLDSALKIDCEAVQVAPQKPALSRGDLEILSRARSRAKAAKGCR